MKKGDLRIRYAPHLFEIKAGLYLNEGNFESLKRAIDDCEARNHKAFIWQERYFDLGYAKFCVERYESVDPSFDEQALEFEAKKKEMENNYLKGLKK